MIVVFVVDTSPSMRQPLSAIANNNNNNDRSTTTTGGGMSRLDLAKMAVEDIVRGLNKRVTEHNIYLQQNPAMQISLRNMGLGYSPNDQFLLLSTGRQYANQIATAACGAGGRLLVGYGDHHSHDHAPDQNNPDPPVLQHHSNVDSFQKQLKRLQATDWTLPSQPQGMRLQQQQQQKQNPFPEDGGGIVGLNTALSAGLQLLSRYRLAFRATENYGMGRLPSPAVLNPSGGPAIHALQPSILIVITDGTCLKATPNEGGGSLQLQYGNMPLREFYQEPFRWDQRIFCLGVGGKEGISSSQFLHAHLRALCEVTGGSHMMLRSSASLGQTTDALLKQIAPPRPRSLPIPDPIRLQARHTPLVGACGTFVAGGPVCSFQPLEGDLDQGQAPSKHRALLLYVPHEQLQSVPTGPSEGSDVFQPPTWCIPESFFPSKKLDTLPPRSAQPNLLFSRFPGRLGSKSFDPAVLMKALNRLDQLVISNRKQVQIPGQPTQVIRLLSRDVYICEWISTDGKAAKGPVSPMSMDYFPVVVTGAARQSLSEGEANYLNIGILHVPSGTSTLGTSLISGTRVSTLTLLPPEPHILLPLLIRAAEAEHRALKKVAAADAKESGGAGGSATQLFKKQALASRNVPLDEHWRNEFRAYLFRVPPYYISALKRSLRNVLPPSAHSLLNTEAAEGALAAQCFSKICLQKIRNAEQVARESNERLERQEAELRRRGTQTYEIPGRTDPSQQPSKRGSEQNKENQKATLITYGQYDPRSSLESYLVTLKNMPAPWRTGANNGPKTSEMVGTNSERSLSTSLACSKDVKQINIMNTLGELPAECLMAYYESRRRWIFGGSGVTGRGIFVDGAPNDGSNHQKCGAVPDIMEASLLSLAGVGVSHLNATSTAKMGDYRERLLWSRAPVVGYGSNDCNGVAATTAADGSPRWSVDDDAMPIAFFNPRTGEFADSVQARVRSRLLVNFGNPYRDKRADSLIPEKYASQSPSSRRGDMGDTDDSPMTPPGSPPHDSYSTTEGEGEAVFAMPVSRVRKSPYRTDSDDTPAPETKKTKTESDDEIASPTTESEKSMQPPPPRAPVPPQSRIEKMDDKVPVESAKPPAPPKVGSTGSPVPPRQAAKPPNPMVKTPIPPARPQTKAKPAPPGISRGPPPPKPPIVVPPPATKADFRRTSSDERPPAPCITAVPPPPNKTHVRRISAGERPPAPPSRPNAPPPPKPLQQQQGPTDRPPPTPLSKATTNPPPSMNTAKKVPPPFPAASAAAAAAVPPPAIDMQSPDKKPAVDLPPGWMTVWSKSQKRWYFFNTKTNKSVWQWPPPT